MSTYLSIKVKNTYKYLRMTMIKIVTIRNYYCSWKCLLLTLFHFMQNALHAATYNIYIILMVRVLATAVGIFWRNLRDSNCQPHQRNRHTRDFPGNIPLEFSSRCDWTSRRVESVESLTWKYVVYYFLYYIYFHEIKLFLYERIIIY